MISALSLDRGMPLESMEINNPRARGVFASLPVTKPTGHTCRHIQQNLQASAMVLDLSEIMAPSYNPSL
jgi:hypothetical protein